MGANTELFAGCRWPPAGLGGGSPTSRAGWSCREAPGTVASETSQLRDSAYGAHTLATTSGLLSAARARLRGCGGEFPGQRARALRSGRGQIEGQASEANADARAKASPPGEALAPRREPGGALSLDPIRTDCRWAGFQLPLFGEAEPPPGQDNLIKLIGEAEDGPPGTRAEGASDRVPLDSRGGWAIRLSQATVPGAKDQCLGLRPDRGSGPCGSPHPLVGCCSSCPQTRRACLPGCHPTSSRGLRPDDLGTVGRMAA